MMLMTMNAIITTTTISELAHYWLKDPFDGYKASERDPEHIADVIIP